VAGTSSALVAPRPLRKDRRRNRLDVIGLDAGPDEDGNSLDDSLLLIGVLTLLPRLVLVRLAMGRVLNPLSQSPAHRRRLRLPNFIPD
jgi:hypothetical protein